MSLATALQGRGGSRPGKTPIVKAWPTVVVEVAAEAALQALPRCGHRVARAGNPKSSRTAAELRTGSMIGPSCLRHMAAASRRYPGGGCRCGVELRAESADLSECAHVRRAGGLGCCDRVARVDAVV